MKFSSRAHDDALVGIFGEQLTGFKRDDINIEFIYPNYNTQFDMRPKVLTGDGYINNVNSELQVGSIAAGSALAQSKDSVRYRAGHTGFCAFTASFKEDGMQYIGPVDTTEGFFIKRTAGVMSVGRRKGGVDYEVSIDKWNGEAFLHDIDFSKINIFQVVFGYLGVASPIFMIRKGTWQIMHTLNTEGILNETTVGNPNFPITSYAENGGEIRSASWNAGVIAGTEGQVGDRFFAFKTSALLSGAALNTIGTFRNMSTFQTVSNKIKASLLRYEFHIDAPNSGFGTVEFLIRKNAVLSGTPSYSPVDNGESVLEIDGVGQYSSGGKLIFPDYVGYSSSGGAGSGSRISGSGQADSSNFGLYLLPGETATVTAQNVNGATNVVVRVIFNWVEYH